MNKKGVIEDLGAMIVPIVAIGIILAVGMLIFSEAKTQVISMDNVARTVVTNSSITVVNDTYVPFADSGGVGTNCMSLSCVSVYNGSTGNMGEEAVDTTEYVCSPAGIKVTNLTGRLNTSIQATFSCQTTTKAYNATGAVQNATQDIPGWLPIIVITIIGGLLIGLVAYFRK